MIYFKYKINFNGASLPRQPQCRGPISISNRVQAFSRRLAAFPRLFRRTKNEKAAVLARVGEGNYDPVKVILMGAAAFQPAVGIIN